MNHLLHPSRRGYRLLAIVGLILSISIVAGCNRAPADRVQGYVEGEYVYIASPFAGQLDVLSVERGMEIKAAAALFTLNTTLETAARDEANRRLAEAQANLEDAKKGKRPSEIQSMQAQLEQARSALVFAENEYSRVGDLMKTGAISRQIFDQDKSNRDQAQQRVTQLEADLQTAELGQRRDQITAAIEEVGARQAALVQAQWNLSQKHQDAPQAGLVFDTLYRQGEWVPSGHPVVALLPPGNIKVRAFIGEKQVGSVHVGQAAGVMVDGVSAAFSGKVSFISPRSEYTPPVIYSRESRDKLVFMIEIVFDPAAAAKLHPGQPVDVQLTGSAAP